MTKDLKIPAAAETALALGNTREAMRLTVAAELRRLADIADVLPVSFQMLRNRAEELDGGN